MIHRLLFLLLFISSSLTLLTAQITWTGEAGDNLWNNPMNWSTNAVPTLTDDVVFDITTLTINPGNATINTLAIKLDAKVTLTGNLTVSPSTTTNVVLLQGCLIVNSGATLTTSGGRRSFHMTNANSKLSNFGNISISSGTTIVQAINVNPGIVTNEACGKIDLDGGQIRVNDATATFINNGFIKTTNTSGLFNGTTGTATNTASYESPVAWPTSTETYTDSGTNEPDPNPLPSVGVNDPTDQCADMVFQGTVAGADATDGSFTISPASDAFITTTTGTATLDVSEATAGTYVVNYTSEPDANQCTKIAHATVTVNAVPAESCECENELEVTGGGALGQIIAGEYMADVLVYSSTKIEDNASVIFRAGEEIILHPGFEVSNNSEFHAFIAPCESSIESNEPLNSRASKNDYTTVPVSLKVSPNPFQGQAKLEFFLPQEEEVAIGVYDHSGRKLDEVISSETLSQGAYEVALNSDQLYGGMFYVILQTPKERIVKKVMVIKN